MSDNFVPVPATFKIMGIHIAAWMVYMLIIVLGTTNSGFNFWVNTICGMIPVILLFYFNVYFLFPKFLQQKKFLQLIGLLVVFNFITICLRHVLITFMQQNPLNNLWTSMFSPVMFWNQFRVNLLFIGISFAYWYAQKNYKIEKDKQRLDKEVLDARLSSLKNQINPHFLYNTLSFLYTKSLPYSAELSGAIAKLSEMMRYSLGEVGDDGKVPLEKEVAHMQNFIEIHQLRFNNTLKICFDAEGDFTQYRIIPLLLITFVENAFKHGKLNDAAHPLKIRLSVSEKNMDFIIQNKQLNGLKERSNGIGLENIRNRLKLSYPGQHDLVIENNGDEFTVNLKLFLS